MEKMHQAQSDFKAGKESTLPAGKLKIFFGYAAGVGKTYAMLEAAQAGEGERVCALLQANTDRQIPVLMEYVLREKAARS